MITAIYASALAVIFAFEIYLVVQAIRNFIYAKKMFARARELNRQTDRMRAERLARERDL